MAINPNYNNEASSSYSNPAASRQSTPSDQVNATAMRTFGMFSNNADLTITLIESHFECPSHDREFRFETNFGEFTIKTQLSKTEEQTQRVEKRAAVAIYSLTPEQVKQMGYTPEQLAAFTLSDEKLNEYGFSKENGKIYIAGPQERDVTIQGVKATSLMTVEWTSEISNSPTLKERVKQLEEGYNKKFHEKWFVWFQHECGEKIPRRVNKDSPGTFTLG